MTPTKICITCGTQFTKKVNVSRKNWEITYYCSRKCINVGRKPHNAYLKPFTCQGCKKLFQPKDKFKKFCSKACSGTMFRKGQKFWLGKKRPNVSGDKCSSKRPEVREKIRQALLGEKSHFWRGGKSTEAHKIRQSGAYRNWRTAVFQRDDYTCQFCKKRGGKLQADHIKPFAYFPELRLDINNGRTLCVACHMETDTYAINLRKLNKLNSSPLLEPNGCGEG